jgi:hypothetical protein
MDTVQTCDSYICKFVITLIQLYQIQCHLSDFNNNEMFFIYNN